MYIIRIIYIVYIVQIVEEINSKDYKISIFTFDSSVT